MLLWKLLLAPSLVAAATLAGRRWGPQVSGWLAGFPLVAGPVLLFYALEQGLDFGAGAALGSLTGLLSLCGFAFVYAWSAGRVPWALSLTAGYAAFFLGTWLLRDARLPLEVAAPLASLALLATRQLLPKGSDALTAFHPPAWDLYVRMAATAAIVLTLTGLAAWLGPQVSGLLTPFPVATTVLVAFAHHQQGAHAAIRVLRGLLGALLGFVLFLSTLAALLPALGLGTTFLLGLAVSVGLQMMILRHLR